MRIGYSWPAGNGRRMWVSMPFWAWVLAWLIAIPFIIAWCAVKVLIWLIQAGARATARAHDAPAVPGRLRQPPRR